jgi:hypothetical protein
MEIYAGIHLFCVVGAGLQGRLGLKTPPYINIGELRVQSFGRPFS